LHPAGKDIKTTCTCTGLYVATVKAKKSFYNEHDAEEEEEEQESGEEDTGKPSKPTKK
jgi:hypothetical protein